MLDDAAAVRVRPMVEADLGKVLTWRNDPKVRNFMFSRHEIGVQEHHAWFERVQREGTRELLIVERAEAPIGFVQFSSRLAGSVAEWGFYTAPDASKGSGHLLGRAALRHSFETLNLHKVCGQALSSNEASIALHRSLGFALEGVLREQCLIDGLRPDLLCFGILKTEWSSHE